MLLHVPEQGLPRCKWQANNWEKDRLTTDNRARKALSLLLVPAKDEDGTPVVAESLFDQMEIYPGARVRTVRDNKLTQNRV